MGRGEWRLGSEDQGVRLSVVLASCRAPELVAAAVERLKPQCRDADAELIVARSIPEGRPDPEGPLDGCRVVRCPVGASIPQLRGAGLAEANGDQVLLTEDNCVPRRDWVKCLAAGFASGADVVGGTMGNAHPDRAVDAGAYFAEYGFFGLARRAPGQGESPYVTGANVAYGRAVVADAAAWASAGEWEGVIHHRLAARGARFELVTDAVVDQNLHYQLGEFCRDRFEHGYNYAKARRAGWGLAKRLAMAGATPLLPPLLTWRAWRNAGRTEPGEFMKALPHTLAFLTAWAAGEATAYLRATPP